MKFVRGEIITNSTVFHSNNVTIILNTSFLQGKYLGLWVGPLGNKIPDMLIQEKWVQVVYVVISDEFKSVTMVMMTCMAYEAAYLCFPFIV